MHSCLNELSTYPSYVADKLACSLVRLQYILEEASACLQGNAKNGVEEDMLVPQGHIPFRHQLNDIEAGFSDPEKNLGKLYIYYF